MPAINVPKRLLQLVFDVAVQSMDFASGFLGDDEVYALRDIAVLLGVDPMVATPSNYCKRIPHAFGEGEPRWHKDRRLICRYCAQPFTADIHTVTPIDVPKGWVAHA